MRVSDERLAELAKFYDSLDTKLEWKLHKDIIADLQDARREIIRLKNGTDRMEIPHDEVVTETKPPNDFEPLLCDGTLVLLRSDSEQKPRKILWSIPDFIHGHRYNVEGAFGLCEKRDINEVLQS